MKKSAFGKINKDISNTHEQTKITEGVFRIRMTLSLLSILACMALMVSSAYALFLNTVSADKSAIRGAYYAINIESSAMPIDNSGSNFVAPLAYKDAHTFKITAIGSASKGYCKITVGETDYYTDYIPQGKFVEITIQAARGTRITFEPGWGTTDEYLSATTCGDFIIHSQTEHAEYKVEATAKLSDIAAYYGVPESDILIYNNIPAVAMADVDSDSTVKLEVGKTLKIPGVPADTVSYAVPFTTYTVEPTAKLEAISSHYGISVADILIYNELENLAMLAAADDINATDISIGTELRIPGVPENTTSYAVPYTVYVVEPTAQITAISLHYGVSIDNILAFNDNLATIGIGIGTLLKIPGLPIDTPRYAVPYAVYKVEPTAKLADISNHYGIPESDILIYNNIKEITTAMELKIPGVYSNATPYAVPFATYVLEPTANLATIALYYNVALEDIVAFNTIELLGVGSTLRIPGVPANTPPYAVPYTTYIVEPTAKLADISKHYGITDADILYYNGISEIKAGMTLKIPGALPSATPYAVPFVIYKVEANAKLADIALHYGVSAADILAYNKISEPTVGYDLKIPGVSGNVTPYVAPAAETPAKTESGTEKTASAENSAQTATN